MMMQVCVINISLIINIKILVTMDFLQFSNFCCCIFINLLNFFFYRLLGSSNMNFVLTARIVMDWLDFLGMKLYAASIAL